MTAPGWYPDPSGDGGQRYWDGSSWGPTAPAPAAQATKAPRPKWLIPAIIGGIILAIMIIELVSGGKKDVRPASAPPSPSSTASPTRTVNDDLQDRVFFNQLAGFPELLAANKGTMIRLGRNVCVGFDERGKEGTLKVLIESGFTLDQSLNIALAGATAYCPEYLAKLN